MEKYYMVQWTEESMRFATNCFPYIFKSKEDAQRYIDEATYYPSEFVVIEAELIDYDEG